MTTIEIVALSVASTLFVVGLVAGILAVRSKVNKLDGEKASVTHVSELEDNMQNSVNDICKDIADQTEDIYRRISDEGRSFHDNFRNLDRELTDRFNNVQDQIKQFQSMIDHRFDKMTDYVHKHTDVKCKVVENSLVELLEKKKDKKSN